MITETLLNSLKSLFSSLGAKTSDNNYAVGLFDKTNGEPKGMMGMSDLASVLGGSTSLHWHNANVDEVINVGLKNNIKFIFVASSSASAHPAIIGVFGDMLISVEQDNYVSVGGSEPEYSGFLLWVYNEGDNIYIKNKSTSAGSVRWSVVY